MKLFVLIGVIIALGGATSVVAKEEHPTTGLIYNAVDISSLTYDCKLQDDAMLECSFNDTAVRRKADPAKLQETLDKARAEFAKEKPNFKDRINFKDCDTSQALETVLSTGVVPPEADPQAFAQKFREMPQTQKNDVTHI